MERYILFNEDMRPAKQKLTNLEVISKGFGLRGAQNIARRVAYRLAEETNPLGFYMTVAFVLEDIKLGVDGITGEKIDATKIFPGLRESDLKGRYSFLPALCGYDLIPRLAKVSCTEEFSKRVEQLHKTL